MHVVGKSAFVSFSLLMNRNKSSHGTVQMKLDFGQKNFKYARCEQCQMVYNLTDNEDRSAHTIFHAKYVTPRVKVSYPDFPNFSSDLPNRVTTKFTNVWCESH